MAVIREAAEKKGVRFDVMDFPDGEIESLQQDVVIFRGSASRFMDRLFKGGKGGVAGKPMGQRRDGGKDRPRGLAVRGVSAHSV